MIAFLSCDWGTTSFRLSLVEAENCRIIESTGSNQGILSVYNSWVNENAAPATRLSFYLDILREQIAVIEKKINGSLDNIPVLLSGMASSSIGMKPIPYQELPFLIDGSDIIPEYLAPEPGFQHDIFLISGVKTGEDVMRGEETQLVGILAGIEPTDTGKLIIFPGTHSKHITVKGRQATGFRTYMTGEFFDLLSKKSILQAGLEEGDGLHTPMARKIFTDGVLAGSGSNLLNACFRVRTNSLFDTLTRKENYYYLSGLLIGAELGEIPYNDTIEIYLSCGAPLKAYYELALEVLGPGQRFHSFSAGEVGKAAIIGQYKIFEKHSKQ